MWFCCSSQSRLGFAKEFGKTMMPRMPLASLDDRFPRESGGVLTSKADKIWAILSESQRRARRQAQEPWEPGSLASALLTVLSAPFG